MHQLAMNGNRSRDDCTQKVMLAIIMLYSLLDAAKWVLTVKTIDCYKVCRS